MITSMDERRRCCAQWPIIVPPLPNYASVALPPPRLSKVLRLAAAASSLHCATQFWLTKTRPSACQKLVWAYSRRWLRPVFPDCWDTRQPCAFYSPARSLQRARPCVLVSSIRFCLPGAFFPTRKNFWSCLPPPAIRKTPDRRRVIGLGTFSLSATSSICKWFDLSWHSV